MKEGHQEWIMQYGLSPHLEYLAAITLQEFTIRS